MSTPDLDNLVKYILDTCKGVLYTDDCLFAAIYTEKIYGIEPKTEFVIEVI